MNTVLVHWSEISLKGNNRSFFENKLRERMRAACAGAIITKLPSAFLVQSKLSSEEISACLQRVFGVSHFLFVDEADTLTRAAEKAITLVTNAESFAVRAKRSDKLFPKTSQEINIEVGEAIISATGKRVCLKDPDVTVFIEVLQKRIFVASERRDGPNGLPTGSSGKLLALLSGGIDSPVASWHLMRRGATCDFIHFHSYPQTDRASIEKALEMAKILSAWQGNARVFLVPLIQLQKALYLKTDRVYLVLLYRRAMMRIAEMLAQREGALGLVTGDSLGQVASQTLENMAAVQGAISLPVYRPLIGMNKDEIILRAREIGTYAVSIEPHADCCSLFIPKHPATRASHEQLTREEACIDLNGFIRQAVAETKTVAVTHNVEKHIATPPQHVISNAKRAPGIGKKEEIVVA